MPTTSSKPGQAPTSGSPQVCPLEPSRISLILPCTFQVGDLGSQDELPSPSQTVTQDQRPIYVELSFLPPLCILCTYYYPIKTVLILTSLLCSLGCCDLIVFLAMSAGGPVTNPSILDSEEVQRRGKGTATLPLTRLSISCSSTLLSFHPA